MPKIDLKKVEEVIKHNDDVSPETRRALLEELMMVLRQDEGDEEKPPAVKKQFCVLISDPDNLLPKTDFAGWVLQIPECESPATTEERIFRSAYDFNTTKKGRLYPAKTVGDALENIPARFFKESEVWVKTKTPVLVLRTSNEIPKADATDKLPFQDLCAKHGATVEIRTDASSVKIDGNGIVQEGAA